MLSNDIGQFFMRMVSKIRLGVDGTVLYVESRAWYLMIDCVPSDGSISMNSFRCLSENEVRTLVMSSAKRYRDLDPMPTSQLIDCLDLLLPVFTHLVNSSLSIGHLTSRKRTVLHQRFRDSVTSQYPRG